MSVFSNKELSVDMWTEKNEVSFQLPKFLDDSCCSFPKPCATFKSISSNNDLKNKICRLEVLRLKILI